MSKFLEGTLPMSAIKLFFKNWGNFTVEINTLVSVSYHKHIGFFKRHPDLMGAARRQDRRRVHSSQAARPRAGDAPDRRSAGTDERSSAARTDATGVPRDSRFQTAAHVGRNRRRVVVFHADRRAHRSLVGPVVQNLDRRNTVSLRSRPIYFSTHEEADLKEHEDGVMGHGSFNKLVMQRILEDGYADTREGYNFEYCALAAVDLYGVMHRAAVELAE